MEGVDEVEEPLAEVVKRDEGRSLACSPREDAEPDFDLVQPGRVARGVDHAEAMTQVCEESLSTGHRLAHASLALHAEVIVDAASARDEPHEGP